MLSRRSVRIKVMQLLYALGRDEDLGFEEALSLYNEKIDDTYRLLLFNVTLLLKIVEFSAEDNKRRKNKHLPSDYDKMFSDKLSNNEIINGLRENKYLLNYIKKHDFENKIDADLAKKIYTDFSKEEVYQNYIKSEEKGHQAILLELFRFCRSNELYLEVIESHFNNYLDDKSLIVGSTKKILKEPETEELNLRAKYYPEDEIVKDFGKVLFERTFQEEDTLTTLIKPHLKNWDHDRVAVIDMILIKMAAIEFECFETIPTKVTINEYVEISKLYSTPKSNEFINGLLDTILVLYSNEGKIKKTGRGLIN